MLLEASYHRHLAGTTDDPFFATSRARCAGPARACPGDLPWLSCGRWSSTGAASSPSRWKAPCGPGPRSTGSTFDSYIAVMREWLGTPPGRAGRRQPGRRARARRDRGAALRGAACRAAVRGDRPPDRRRRAAAADVRPVRARARDVGAGAAGQRARACAPGCCPTRGATSTRARAGTRCSTPSSSPARWACASPSRQIFAHALDLLGVAADQTVFVDDLRPNVTAAEALGLVGVHHRRTTRLRRAGGTVRRPAARLRPVRPGAASRRRPGRRPPTRPGRSPGTGRLAPRGHGRPPG